MIDIMIIGVDSEVILYFDLKLEDGLVVDSICVNNKFVKMVMGDGSLMVNFEVCLLGLKKGDKKVFILNVNDVFGEFNFNNVYYMEKSRFGSDLKIEEGMILVFL